MEQDEWAGDGNHQDVFSEQIAKLPECRNDHEFGSVSGMCGYMRISVGAVVGNGLDEDGDIVDSLL